MCRLYGFRANEQTKVECTLVRAQNALMVQSGGDLRGQTHRDGWGIAVFEDSVPEVERRATAADEDLRFSVTAERVFAHTVVAHVRDATVGGAQRVNSHPFHHGRWVFAHNGTIRAFDRLGSVLAEETDPDLLSERHGSTDSEMAFLWLLTRLRRAGVDLTSSGDEVATLAEVVGSSVRELSRRCLAAGAEKEERLNFLLTDGQSLVVSRWHNGLYWVLREGVHDCEVCGIPHVEHDPRRDYRAVVVASEPISDEAWQEVPDASMLVVDAQIEAQLLSI